MAAESEAKEVYKEAPFVIYGQLFFITVFISGALVENNTASECIRTVAATMVVKFYNYEYKANEYGYEANC